MFVRNEKKPNECYSYVYDMIVNMYVRIKSVWMEHEGAFCVCSEWWTVPLCPANTHAHVCILCVFVNWNCYLHRRSPFHVSLWYICQGCPFSTHTFVMLSQQRGHRAPKHPPPLKANHMFDNWNFHIRSTRETKSKSLGRCRAGN